MGIAKYVDALGLLDRAIQLDSSYPWNYGFKGWALERVGKPDKAMDAYKKAANLDDKSLEWQVGVANSLYAMGQIKEASSNYSSIVDAARKRPVDPDILSQ